MPATDNPDHEARDAQTVNQAVAAMMANDPATAESLLLQVIANTPEEYQNATEDAEGGLTIKFWDQQAFVHYAMWQQQQGVQRSVRWALNAYPRAHYYLGFLYVKTGQFQRALEYLERGSRLEPTNPKFSFEKAQALAHAGDHAGALALYEAIREVGPHVSALDLAVARRGCGFVLIELNRLEEAEAALQASLEFEPGNPIALGELEYIQQLRSGGEATQGELVATQGPPLSRCAVCDSPFSKGKVLSQGVLRTVCERCERKLTKRWWQFWK